MSNSVYEIITERIIQRIQTEKKLPWKQPWKQYLDGTTDAPQNFVSKKSYKGVNVWVLKDRFATPFWLSYKQCAALGGQVRKGEKGSPVVYWSFPKVKDSKTGKEKVVPFIKYYTVFNVEQCDGLNIEQRTERIFSPVERIANCEELLSKIEPKPVIQHKEARAYYLGGNSDFVNMPVIESFDSPENYYAVLFHELGHWTGHSTRLNRDMSGSFGSTAYAKEELCAEMTANFLISETGIQLPEENTIAYLQSWITTLKNDVTLLVRASSLAQKASDFLLGRTEAKADESTETELVAA